MISRGILLHSRFHTTSLASSTCLEPPWILHSAASFWLTVDSVIEPKRGACSHCLRTCRRSGETFLQVRKRKKNRHSLSYFSLSFLIYSARPFMYPLCASDFPGSSNDKESSCNEGDLGVILGSGRSPGGRTKTHSSILVWRIPWTEEPDWLQSVGSQRVGHDQMTNMCQVLCWGLTGVSKVVLP